MTLENQKSSPLLPDFYYLWKVCKRHWRFATACFSMIMMAGFFLSSAISDVYRSSVVAFYDRRDAFDISGMSGLNSIAPETVENNFVVSLSNAEMLTDITKSIEVDTVGIMGRLMQKLNLRDSEQSEASRRSALVKFFEKRALPITNYGTGTLTLQINLERSPDLAQKLATITMDAFIQRELRATASNLAVKVEFLRASLEESRQNLARMSATEKSPQQQANRKATEPSLDLRQQEASILDRIRLLENEIIDTSDDRTRRRSVLEAEFNNMQSKLSPYHPEVTAKRRELQALIVSPNRGESVALELGQLRRELWSTRARMLLPGQNMHGSGSMSEQFELDRIAQLSRKIEELELERSNVEKQATDPDSRTRFTIVKSASYEDKPVKSRKKQILLAAIALSLLIPIVIIMIQEIRSPIARDAWRIARFTNVPFIGQISEAVLDSIQLLTPSKYQSMRLTLDQPSKDKEHEQRVVLAYRSIELALLTKRQRSVFGLVTPSDSTSFRNFSDNLSNIIALDTSLPTLIIDFDFENQSDKNQAGPDLLDTILDHHQIEASLARPNNERAYYMLQIKKPIDQARQAAFRTDKISALFSALREKFPRILVRGMSEKRFIENHNIFTSVDEIVMVVDARQSRYADIKRNLAQTDTSKIGGLFSLEASS
jgi:hypothetical protein